MPAEFSPEITQYIDQLEALITSLNGYVDGLETLGTAQGTKLDQLHTDLVALQGYVDGLEGLDTSIRDYLDTVETKLQTLITGPVVVESSSGTFEADETNGYDAFGNLIAWTENGVDYEATYSADGTKLLTMGPV